MRETLTRALNKIRSIFTRNDAPPKPVVTPQPAPQPRPAPTPTRPVVTTTPIATAPIRPVSVFRSTHFKLEEFHNSETARARHIDNTPPAAVIENLNWLCLKVLDPLRDKIAKPINISSGYRSPALNAVIGGVGNSQHSLGQAVDFTVTGMSVQQVFDFITKKTTLPYDQVIYEFGQWIHISFDHGRAQQRGQKLIAKKVNGATVYSNA